MKMINKKKGRYNALIEKLIVLERFRKKYKKTRTKFTKKIYEFIQSSQNILAKNR